MSICFGHYYVFRGLEMKAFTTFFFNVLRIGIQNKLALFYYVWVYNEESRSANVFRES